MTKQHNADHCTIVHRKLFPTYDELLAECCAKEAALIAHERSRAGTDNAQEIYQRAIDTWGGVAQLRMLQEECSELAVAVSHFVRARVGPWPLAEEVADVLIMCEQAKRIVGAELVDGFMRRKLARLEERVGKAREVGELAGAEHV